LAPARVPVRRLRARRIVVETDEPYVPVGNPLGELVRARADVLLERPAAGRVVDLLGHDRRGAIREGDEREQRGERFFQLQRDRVLGRGRGGLHLFVDGGAPRAHLPPALERGDDVLGGHLLAVVKRDVLAQDERVGQPSLLCVYDSASNGWTRKPASKVKSSSKIGSVIIDVRSAVVATVSRVSGSPISATRRAPPRRGAAEVEKTRLPARAATTGRMSADSSTLRDRISRFLPSPLSYRR